MRKLIALAALLLMLPYAHAADFEEGVHYRELSQQQSTQTGDKVEVRELFWYHCPHCYSLEKPLRDWVATMPENAEFVVMPAVLGESWEFHARVYYTLQALGALEAFHEPLFDAIHARPRPLNRVSDPQQVAQWLAENGGPSSEEFMDAFESFAVDTHTRNAVVMTGRYEITGVPSVAVAGKYITTVTMAGNYDTFFEVIEHLIELASGS
jgi:protein dithiol oxidoreductase (disulfide-forming)